MLAILFATAALLHVLMFVLTLRLKAGLPEWLLRILLLGLIVDNLALAIAPLAFESSWYYPLSELRYVAHVLVLPPLAVAAVAIANRAGIQWSLGLSDLGFAAFFAAAAISYGWSTEIVNLQLVAETLYEHTRYVSAHASPPIATIATNAVILVVAAILWRRSGWRWLFVGAASIFLVNGGFASSDFGIVAGNIAEVLFVASWIATLYRFRMD